MSTKVARVHGNVIARDKQCCRYCGRRCAKRKPGLRYAGSSLTFDHIRPVSAGGTTDEANIVIACRGCNQTKADMVLSNAQLRQIDECIKNSATPKQIREFGSAMARALLERFRYEHDQLVRR